MKRKSKVPERDKLYSFVFFRKDGTKSEVVSVRLYDVLENGKYRFVNVKYNNLIPAMTPARFDYLCKRNLIDVKSVEAERVQIKPVNVDEAKERAENEKAQAEFERKVRAIAASGHDAELLKDLEAFMSERYEGSVFELLERMDKAYLAVS